MGLLQVRLAPRLQKPASLSQAFQPPDAPALALLGHFSQASEVCQVEAWLQLLSIPAGWLLGSLHLGPVSAPSWQLGLGLKYSVPANYSSVR